MNRLVVAFATTLAIAGFAQDASAQATSPTAPAQQKPASKPKAPRPPLGLQAFFALDVEQMSASNSFRASTGSSTFLGYGVGADVQNLWRNVFARVSLAQASKSGDRGFMVNGVFVPSGFTVDIGMRTVELGAGWRRSFKDPRRAAHFAGGLLLLSYSEKTAEAPEENLDESHNGYFVAAGFDYRVSRKFWVGGEGFFRTVAADASGGIAKNLGDNNLGGVGVRILAAYQLK
jgi:hypothetical protein